MNIFIFDLNHRLNVQYHADKHVVKMITEYNQILSATHWLTGSTAPYRLTHQKHPCVLWCLQSTENYRWLVTLNQALCQEYTYRYDKTHKGQQIVDILANNIPNLSDSGLTPFVQAMPEQYRHQDVVTAYRQYFIGEKQHLAHWKRRDIPQWFLFMKHESIDDWG
jgi:hypothetical protein